MAPIKHNTLAAFLDKTASGDLPKIFLICGEPFLVRQAYDRLVDFLLRGQSREFALDALDGRTTPIGDVIEQVATFSFLQSTKVIAVKDAPLFTLRAAPGEIAYSQKDQELLAGLAEKGIPDNHVLVMTSDAPDKRRKIYKTVADKGLVIDCTVAQGARKADLDEQQAVLRELSRQLLAGTGKQMDPQAFNALLEQTGFNPEIFARNIEKLLAYTATRSAITVKDVMAVVHRDKKDPIFSLTNAILERDTTKALTLLNNLFAEGFHPLQILKTLENQVRKLLAIKCFLTDLYQDNPGLPPVKTMHFNGFKQVMIPRVIARDKADTEQVEAWETAMTKASDSKPPKPAKAGANDLLLAPNPKSAYPVFQNFLRSESFSLNELRAALIRLSDLDHALKTSAVLPEIGIEHFITTLCRKGGTLETA